MALIEFDPAKYSLEELRFLLPVLGKSPAVALADPLPSGVNPVAVREALGTFYELEELREHRGQPWVGLRAIEKTIETFLEQYINTSELFARGAPRFSSMYQWDARGAPHYGGVGSDSGQVRSWIDPDGKRQSFTIPLRGARAAFIPDWVKPPEPLPNDFDEDATRGVVACPLCGKSETYNPASPMSRGAARARLGKHCRSITGEHAERHRELARHIFG